VSGQKPSHLCLCALPASYTFDTSHISPTVTNLLPRRPPLTGDRLFMTGDCLSLASALPMGSHLRLAAASMHGARLLDSRPRLAAASMHGARLLDPRLRLMALWRSP
jgi:hypothetical protein